MPVDSYKFLPRSFRSGFESVPMQAETPVWSPLERPVERATIALLSSAGLYLQDTQEPFDVERERREPLWGDPSYRLIPRGVEQRQIGATHLHINTRDIYDDFNVALPIHAFAELERDGVIGRLADEHYGVMGFQESGAEVWRTTTGPAIVARLKQAAVDALVLAPA